MRITVNPDPTWWGWLLFAGAIFLLTGLLIASVLHVRHEIAEWRLLLAQRQQRRQR